KKYKYAEFFNRYKRAIEASLGQILSADIYKNIHMVNQENVVALCSIDRQGYIEFRQMLIGSKRQPYFNYIAEKSLDYAGSVGEVPEGLFQYRTQERILMPVEISFIGKPKFVWIYSIPEYK
ncbi:hypothetical protein ACFL6D_04845, partial [Spirochaetota bacterium]